MQVGSEPCSGCDAVFINYAQWSEEFILMVFIPVMSQNYDFTITEGEKRYERDVREGVERFDQASFLWVNVADVNPNATL